MLARIPIKTLYPLALAEGEGVGTAYEYYAKRLVLAPFLRRLPRPRRILVAGLPEKYGSSLDFLLLASELSAQVVVADHRPDHLSKAQNALAAAQAQGLLKNVAPQYARLTRPAVLAEVEGAFDMALSCEVLQSLTLEERPAYWRRLVALASAVALFAPNAGNPDHGRLSGLQTVSLAELRALSPGMAPTQVGLADLPPFPTGMIRSAEQHRQAATGRMENILMWGLGYYARLEPYAPAGLRRRYAHMVYALAANPQ